MNKFKYIYKMYPPSPPGFFVRAPKFVNGKLVGRKTVRLKQSEFRIKEYGSETAAKNAAVERRDQYLKKNNAMHLLTAPANYGPSDLEKKRSLTGVRGVTIIRARGTLYYIATYYSNRIMTTRRYSQKKHGKKGAFLLACRARYEAKGTLQIINKRKLICPPGVPFENA